MEMKTFEMFCELYDGGYAYRYTPENFVALSGGGQPYPSWTREVCSKTGIFVEEMIQPVLNPVSLNSGEKDYLEALARAWPIFMKAQLKIFGLAKQGKLPERISQLIRMCCTEKEWQSASKDPDYLCPQPFIRLDAVRTEEGFKVVDINSTRPAGIGDLILAEKAMRGYFSQEFGVFPTAEILAKAIASARKDWEVEFGRKITLEQAILVREEDGDWNNFRLLQQFLGEQGISFEFVTSVEEFQRRKGTITLVLRSRIKEGDPLFPLLEEGYPEVRCILSPIYRRFLGNKLWMYLVKTRELKDIFQEALGQSYELVASCFAEVGVVDKNGLLILPDTAPKAVASLSGKEWVLKEPGSSSGKKMVLGAFMGKERWRGMLSQVKPGWVGQKLYLQPEEFIVLDEKEELKRERMFVKYGIFILGGELAGLEVMCRRTPLVHGARNTYISPVFFRNQQNREG